MNVSCEMSKLSTLKAGGKAVLKLTDDALDIVSEHFGNFRDKPLFITLKNKEGDSLRVPCNMVNMESLNKGGKLIIAFSNEVIDTVTKDYKKMRGELDMALEVDTDKFREIQSQISPEQRKKVFAIFRDIGNHLGQLVPDVELTMKQAFLLDNPKYTEFSLSNCSKELAGDFITFLIMFCFTQGVELKEHPREAFDDLEKYLWICVKMNVCCVCGKVGAMHIVGQKKITLCPEHQQEWQNKGREFYLKYHVKPIEV